MTFASRRSPLFLLLPFIFVLAGHQSLHGQVPVGIYEIDDSLSDDIDTAINAATANMNFIVRPIARKRLRATNPPTEVITIDVVADSILITSDNRIFLRTKPDGVPVKWTSPRGDEVNLTTTLEGDVLSNTFAAGDGARTNRYTLREDGLLEMLVTITSPKLERPLEYKRIYRRTTADP